MDIAGHMAKESRYMCKIALQDLEGKEEALGVHDYISACRYIYSGWEGGFIDSTELVTEGKRE